MDMITKITLLTFLLVGCGVTATQQEPTQTDFIMVSTGSASLIYKALVGGVDYCKITKHGIQHNDFGGSINWDGKKCVVYMEAGNAISE